MIFAAAGGAARSRASSSSKVTRPRRRVASTVSRTLTCGRALWRSARYSPMPSGPHAWTTNASTLPASATRSVSPRNRQRSPAPRACTAGPDASVAVNAPEATFARRSGAHPRAGSDGVAAAAQLLIAPVRGRSVALRHLRLLSDDLDRQLGEALVRLGPPELCHRPLGAGNAGALEAG